MEATDVHTNELLGIFDFLVITYEVNFYCSSAIRSNEKG
jgi:hypothetical protein